MYDEVKITRDNIIELSQYKVGDTVTLLKKTEDNKGVYHAGHVMFVKNITIDPCIDLPNMTIEKFKSKYIVHDHLFTLFLSDKKDQESEKTIQCNASDVVKGKVTDSDFEEFSKKLALKRKHNIQKSVITLILALISVAFIYISLSIDKMLLSNLFAIIVLACNISIILIMSIGDTPYWTKIKKA